MKKNYIQPMMVMSFIEIDTDMMIGSPFDIDVYGGKDGDWDAEIKGNDLLDDLFGDEDFGGGDNAW